MFRTISGIKVDGGLPGQFSGGGIYNASCSFGFSGNPTKITLNLVAEDANALKANITKEDLVVHSGHGQVGVGPHTIEFGSHTFFNMYLYSYNFSDSPTAKTATVNFVDWSIALDKIFVGLTGRHDTFNTRKRSMDVRFRVICAECNSLTPMRIIIPDDLNKVTYNADGSVDTVDPAGGGPILNTMTGWDGTAATPAWEYPDEDDYENTEMTDIALGGAKVTRSQNIAGGISFTNPNRPAGSETIDDPGFHFSENLTSANPLRVVDGGYIILGRESFSDTNCEIPKVSYTFSDLCNIFDFLLLDPHSPGANNPQHNLRDFEDRSILETSNAAYEANYTGTLREVLSSWAADLSFDYVIDSTRGEINGGLPYLHCFDLAVPVDLDDIHDAIKDGFGSETTQLDHGLIRSVQTGMSMENTYTQTPIVKYIKPARSQDRESRTDTEKVGKVVRVIDAIGTSAHLGRSDSELMTSIALAKYNSDARLMWLSHRAAHVTIDKDADGNPLPLPHPINSGAFLSLGFLPVQEVTAVNAKQETIYAMKLQSPGDVASVNHPVWTNPDNYSLWIGIFNKQAQEAISRFDAELADFLGQWGYFNQPVPPNIFDCPTYTDADGNDYHYDRYAVNVSTIPESKMYSGHSYPFKKILRSNGGEFALNKGALNTNNDPKNVFQIEDNAWGTAQENVDWALENPYLVINADQANFPGVDWQNAVRHSDIENYVPIYSYFNNNRVLNNFFTRTFPNWEKGQGGADALFRQNDWASGYMPGIALIPNLDLATGISGKKILDVYMSTTAVAQPGGGFVNELDLEPNPMVFSNARRRRLEHFNMNLSPRECKTYCEESIVKEICECAPMVDPFHGFYDYDAPVLFIEHLNRTAKVIFPVQSDYSGFFVSKSTWRGTTVKIQEVQGTPSDPTGSFVDGLGTLRKMHNLPPGTDWSDPRNVMATRVVEVDATPEIDALQEAVGTFQSTVIAQSPNGKAMHLYDLPTYYNFHRSTVLSAPVPTETINIKVEGTEYGTLAPIDVFGNPIYTLSLLTPAHGLTSFSVSLDGDGVVSDLTFSSRPPKLPKRDVLIQQLGPRFLDGKIQKPPGEIRSNT